MVGNRKMAKYSDEQRRTEWKTRKIGDSEHIDTLQNSDILQSTVS